MFADQGAGARWPPNHVVAFTETSQAGTQFPLAAKMGCCQSGPSQAAVGPRGTKESDVNRLATDPGLS